MCVCARLVTGVWPVLREKLHRCEHTTVLRQPFNGFIIRQYYNNKFVASVDFDFEWLASKIIFTPIYISRSEFVAAGREKSACDIFKAGNRAKIR